MDSIKNMPYFKNEAAKSGDFTLGHEAAIAVKFKECAFNEEFKITYPKLSKKILKTWARSGNESDLESSVDMVDLLLLKQKVLVLVIAQCGTIVYQTQIPFMF